MNEAVEKLTPLEVYNTLSNGQKKGFVLGFLFDFERKYLHDWVIEELKRFDLDYDL